MIRAKNYNLTATFLVAVSIAITVFAATQLTNNNVSTTLTDQKLAQFDKDGKPKLKLGKRPSHQISPLFTLSGESETDLPVINKSGALMEDETWEAGYVYKTNSSTEVSSGVTLTIEAGAIIKSDGYGIYVAEGGALDVAGTSLEPVIFTSIYDDSAGGDSNSDGGASSPSIGSYRNAIYNNGHASIAHAIFNYADTDIAGGAGANTALSVVDSQFVGSSVAIKQYAHVAILERNYFDVMPGQYNKAAVQLDNVQDISTVSLSGVDLNKFNGNNTSRIVYFYRSVLPYNKTQTVSPVSNAIAQIGQGNIDGELTMKGDTQLLMLPDAMTVNGVLNLEPGVTVKYGGSGAAIIVGQGGILNAGGTSVKPIIFTSQYDDSVGGDTTGDGNSTSPTSGDYGYAVFATNGANVNIEQSKIFYANTAYMLYGEAQLNVSDAIVEHASRAFVSFNGEANLTGMVISDISTGLQVSNGSVVFRGAINDISNTGISACNWGTTNCSVDASYTDWGSASGPNTSSQTLVCGQVTIAPWTYNGNAVHGGLFGSPNCDNSPTPDQQLNTSTAHFSERMSLRGIDCGNGFQDACDAMQTAQSCLGAATSLAASTSSFLLPNGNAYDQPAQWGSALASNASDFIQSVEGAVPILEAASFATKLLGAATTVLNVANAYSTCAP